MRFEWDPNKAIANFLKHAVSFEEAKSALSDALALTARDPDHSLNEERYITFGVSSSGRLLVVAHTERGDTTRIVSARAAKKAERRLYEEG